MNPHIERAARAIKDAFVDPLRRWNEAAGTTVKYPEWESDRHIWERLGHAALSTAVEPSEEEIMAASKAACCPSGKCAADDPAPLMYCQKGKYLVGMRAALIAAARARVAE